MPGTNPQQASLIALTDLRTALQGFSLVPNEILAKQNQIIAELSSRLFKQPAIYKQGTGYDFNSEYQLANTQTSSQADFQWQAYGVLNIRVLDLQAADKVRLKMLPINGSDTTFPFFFAYALTTAADSSQTIPSDQFCLLGQADWFTPCNADGDGVTTPLWAGFAQFTVEEIPCAGYRYLHLMGGNLGIEGGKDWWDYFDNVTAGMMGYSLLK